MVNLARRKNYHAHNRLQTPRYVTRKMSYKAPTFIMWDALRFFYSNAISLVSSHSPEQTDKRLVTHSLKTVDTALLKLFPVFIPEMFNFRD